MNASDANQIPILAVVAGDIRMEPRVTLSPFVEIQRNARIGERCKISSHSFICEGVTIEDEVLLGHGVIFINDRRPRATNEDGSLQSVGDWRLETNGSASASVNRQRRDNPLRR